MSNEDRYDYLRSLRNSGTLKHLLELGLISYKPLFFLDVYEEYDKQLKLGNTKMLSIEIVCSKFKIKSYSTIYRIINFFNENRDSNTNS